MAIVTSTICDLCNCTATHKQQKIQVVQMTEQTEGRFTTPYLDIKVMDLCDTCLQKFIDSNKCKCYGAMGYNRYEFEDEK